MDLSKYYTKEKLNVIFERLNTHIERNFKSFICKDSILNIKFLLERVIKEKKLAEEFFEEGVNFQERGVIFIEAVSIFDFLRKNFIAHLPNNIDLREAKRVERLFDEIVNNFSKGYVYSYIKLLIDKIEFFIKHGKIKEYNETLFYHLESHYRYFQNFLKSILDEKEFKNTKHTECDFGKWLAEHGKTLIEDDESYREIKHFHKNFHNLISICSGYKKSGLYKEMFFVIKEIEATSLWLSNEIGYVNAKLLSLESSKDFLTGLFNRRALNQIFKKYQEISELINQPISIVVADIDYFKKINDTYGHLAGDAALKHFAEIIKRNLRKSDFVFRIGGEEFLILLPNTNLEEAAKIAENLRAILEKSPLVYEGREINLTASFGVAELKDNSQLNELIKEADEKLYIAKREGRNKVIS